jgi:hypothetical protein
MLAMVLKVSGGAVCNHQSGSDASTRVLCSGTTEPKIKPPLPEKRKENKYIYIFGEAERERERESAEKDTQEEREFRNGSEGPRIYRSRGMP